MVDKLLFEDSSCGAEDHISRVLPIWTSLATSNLLPTLQFGPSLLYYNIVDNKGGKEEDGGEIEKKYDPFQNLRRRAIKKWQARKFGTDRAGY